MKTLSERLNMSTTDSNPTAITFDPRKDINYGETIMLYCANNDIDISNIDETDYDSATMILSDFAADARRAGLTVNFWIEV